MTPAPAPKVVSGCVAPSRSIRRRPTVSSSAGTAASTVPSALVSRKRRPARGGPRRQRLSQHFLRPRQSVARLLQRLRQPLGGKIGDRVERRHHVLKRLPPVVEHLHHGADADRGEKGDDQHRHRAAKQRFGGQKPPIRRIGDRLSEALDRIVTRRRTRHFGARHEGLRSDCPLPPWIRKGCAASPSESVAIWNPRPLICRESRSQLFKNFLPTDHSTVQTSGGDG